MRPYASFVALCAILCGCAPDTPQPVKEGQRLVLTGRALAAESSYDAARIAFEEALTLDSLDTEAHFELGNLDARLGRLEAAVRAYRAAIVADPAHHRARHNLAVTEADRGRLPVAVELLEQMPTFAPALRTLPLFYAKQGRYDLVEKTLRAALATGGDHVDVRQQLGQLYLRQGRYADAEAELERALALDSALGESHRLMGLSHLAQGRYAKALAAFERVIAYEPLHIEAQYNLASALSALGRLAEAESALVRFETHAAHAAQVARLRRQVDVSPDHIETRLQLAHHYRQRGQTEAALTHYRAAHLAEPAHLETLIQLSGLLLEQGRADEVLELCRRGVAQHPGDPRIGELHFAMGLVHLRRNQYHQARTDFERAVELNPSSAEAWNNLGNALLALGEAAEARRALEAAVSADPTLADAPYNLGSLFLQQGRLDQARLAYLAAIAADSTFARTYYALAAVYEAHGDIPQARENYQTFIELWQGDPDFLRQARARLDQLH
jgi:tetratricopeptide (TPR) repeat protein